MVIKRAFIQTTFGLIHYRTAGSQHEHKRPIFMLHASPASSKFIEPVIQLVANNRWVIAPDTLGCGDSEPPSVADPDMQFYARSIIAMANALGIDEFDLYGTHTGSHIAIEMAIANPSRIKCLLLDGVAIFSKKEQQEHLLHYAPPQKIAEMGEHFSWSWNFIREQMLFYPHYKKTIEHLRPGGSLDPKFIHDLAIDVLKNIENYHQAYEAVFKHEVKQRLPLISQPVLVFKEKDSVLDVATDTTIKLLKHGKIAKVLLEDFELALKFKAAAIETFCAN